jgi:lysophospholipase L1-like esterase
MRSADAMADRPSETGSKLKSWFGNALLLIGSAAFALAAAELLLRAVAPQNFDLYPRGMYVEDAEVGYVLTPGFDGVLERAEFRHSVTIGPGGLRGADPRPRRDNTFRIVALGDSFTWGFGVTEEEAFPALLERSLAHRHPDLDLQVLNAGVPGYGTIEALRFFASRLELLDPDLVVLTFLNENDFIENRDPALGRVRIEDGWLRSPIPPRDQPWQTLDVIKSRSHAARLISERAGYLASRTGLVSVETTAPRITQEDARLAIELLGQIAQTAAARGAASIFMFVTGQGPVISEREASIAGSDAVAEAARRAGAGYVDLPPLLRARPDRFDLYYRRDGHWTAAGHMAAAEILAAYIDPHHGEHLRSHAARHLEEN